MFELKSHKDHTSNPEEDDIVASYKNTCWIPLFKLRSLLRPPHCSKWPQARAEPCIKNVWILCNMTVAMRTFRNIVTTNDCFTAIIAVPCRNTMAPPQLTEIVQSRIFSSQFTYVFVKRSGTNSTS